MTSFAIAIAGSLVAAQPASAVYDPVSTLQYQTVTRGNPQISGSTVTDTVALQTGERSYSYSLNLNLASVGNPYTLGTALSNGNKPTLTFSATSGGNAITTNTQYSSWWIEYSSGSGYSQWDPATGATLPTGTYTDFKVVTSGSFGTAQSGPKTISVTYSIAVNSSTVAPRGFANNSPSGLNVDLPTNVMTYVPVTDDQKISAAFRACIWVADQSGLTTGDSVQISASNSESNSTGVSYIYPSVYKDGNTIATSSIDQTTKSFTLPAAASLIETSIQVYVNTLTVGQAVSLAPAAKKGGVGANMLDTCFKASTATSAAPTVTANGSSTTLSWSAPSDLGSAGYTSLYVLACATSVSSCATLSSLTSMMTRGFSFTNATALSTSATTFTATASSMSAGMGSQTSWSASTAYKYAILYTKAPIFQAGWINILPSYTWIGGPSSATAASAGSSPQSPSDSSSATVERSIPTPVFQAPILNSLAPKMSAGFSSNGGRLVLKDVKPTDITSVTLNGKTVAVVPSKSGAALRIPAGAGAGDLKFTMADGTVIDVANAVKITPSQVDPKLVDLNNLPTFKAGSVAVPSTIKAALAKNKEVILDSANAKCVGYASSNTASAKATALSRASNVCGVITDMNENIEPIIKVLVNKVVAKKSPVKYQTW